jgi:hypothetical protein
MKKDKGKNARPGGNYRGGAGCLFFLIISVIIADNFVCS